MELVQSKGSEASWPKYTFDLKVKDGNLTFSNLVPVNSPSWRATVEAEPTHQKISITKAR